MEIYDHIAPLPEAAQGGILAIGNFDGVHRGHRALLQAAQSLAGQQGRACGVLTFEPHPRHLFRPDDPPFRISPAPLKHERLAEAGMDYLFSLPFDWDFASQSAEDFIKNVLDDFIKPAHIVIGPDFRFGQLRKGDAESLRAAGYDVTSIEKAGDETGGLFSSSAIRGALRHGDLDKANAMLGWDWEMRGPVVKGDQRGREMGFPTANIPLDETLHPAYGVYATWVQIEGEDIWRAAATNIGIRPMFEIPVGQIEAHIFDFDRDIYGKTLRVKPVQRLRGEAKYDSLDALIAQIEQDCGQARTILTDLPSP